MLGSGARLRPKGQQSIPPNDRLVLAMAGGGGFGNPKEREPALVAQDVRNGLVSVESALANYGVAVNTNGDIDAVATAAARL